MWIPRVFSRNCISKNCTGNSYVAKKCVNTTNNMAYKDFDKFMSAKLEYTWKDLLKQVLSKYHSIIEIFMKSNADIVAEH